MSEDYSMFALADRLREMRDRKTEVEAELKWVNGEIERFNQLLVAEMVDQEVPRFDRDGKTFYIRSEIYPSVDPERRDVLYEVIRENGFGDLIKETINFQTLAAFIKEQMRENNDQLPDWLEGLVNVFEKESVVLRRGATPRTNKNKEAVKDE